VTPGVSPYLTIDGVLRAIEFYKTVFGAEELGVHMAEDGKRVMHAALRINGGLVMLSDSFPEFGDYPPPDPSAARLYRSAWPCQIRPRWIACTSARSITAPPPSWTLRTPFGERASPCSRTRSAIVGC
jgi:hypothetical protein